MKRVFLSILIPIFLPYYAHAIVRDLGCCKIEFSVPAGWIVDPSGYIVRTGEVYGKYGHPVDSLSFIAIKKSDLSSQNFDTWVSQAVNEEVGTGKVKDGEPCKTADNRNVIVKILSYSSHSEVDGYFEYENCFVIASLYTKSPSSFEPSYPDFRQLIKSLKLAHIN